MVDVCNTAYEEAKELLKSKGEEVKKLAGILMEKETVELNELIEIFGHREGAEEEVLSKYLKDLKTRKETA